MLKRDIGWIINGKYIDKELSKLLIKISNTNISKRNKAYVNYFIFSGFIEFKNEDKYPNINYNHIGYKLLSLFRYWNIIEEDWESVLTEFISKFIETKDKLEYKPVISEFTKKIHDSHARFVNFNVILEISLHLLNLD